MIGSYRPKSEVPNVLKLFYLGMDVKIYCFVLYMYIYNIISHSLYVLHIIYIYIMYIVVGIHFMFYRR